MVGLQRRDVGLSTETQAALRHTVRLSLIHSFVNPDERSILMWKVYLSGEIHTDWREQIMANLVTQ